jgi:magnesium chelatase family protein
MIQRYMQKISGPLMDRIDIHIDVPAVNYKEMRAATEPEGSAQIRERVLRAREIQLRRFEADSFVRPGHTPSSSDRSVRPFDKLRAGPTRSIFSNAQMTPRHIRAFCELSADCERLLERAMTQQGLTARAHDRILKVARTVADLEGSQGIEPKHIAEAIQYRTLDRTFWA